MKRHRNVSTSQEAQAEHGLCEAVATLRSAGEVQAFFKDLCTPAELQALADRWAVVEWLQRGLPYREIQRLTGVSVTTIGRVARCLAGADGGYALAVRRIAPKRPPAARRTESPRRAEPVRRQEALRNG